MQPIPAEGEATQRFDGVDTLRGISIVAVVLLHAWLRFYLVGTNPLPNILPRWLFFLLFRNGGNGVTVFFAISGFLITYTSLRRFGRLAALVPRAFYRIRFARIAPPLLLVLAVLSALHLLHANGFRIATPGVGLARALFSALTFHLNWLEARYGYLPANWDVLWSLSVEEMFYLFFPLLCLLLLRMGRVGMALFVLSGAVLIVLAPLGRTIWAPTDVYAEKSYLGGMGSIAMGVLTALLVHRLQRCGTVPRQHILLVAAWTGAALMLVAAPPFRSHASWRLFMNRWDLDDSLLTLGACIVIAALVLRNRAGHAWTAPLRWFGRHSYEIYLTHEFVVVWITMLAFHVMKTHAGRGLGHGVIVWIAITLLLTVPLGFLFARYVSEPLNRRLRQV